MKSQRKKKIIHIIADPKFVSQIGKYEFPEVENSIIFWGGRRCLPPKYDRVTVYLSAKEQKSGYIASECKNADLVVVYSLIQEAILQLPKETKVVWRFFGYEIYERELSKVLSSSTLSIWKKMYKKSISRYLKDFILSFFSKLSPFYRAIERVDYFLGTFREEYDLLRRWGYNLPPFFQAFPFPPNKKYQIYKKKPILLLGNSRTFFNNHLDIIEKVKRTRCTSSFMVKLLFSYGKESLYTQIVREQALQLPHVELAEKFIPMQEFEQIYEESAALVINSYRQMALGNIFIALKSGTKVYLSKKNITLDWLRNNGFKVWSIEEDLEEDLKTINIFLPETDAWHNYQMFINLTNSYASDSFKHCLMEVLQKKDK